MKQEKKLIMGILVFVGLVTLLGGTYAFVTKSYLTDSEFALIAENIVLALDDDTSDTILVEDGYPLHDALGIATTPYTFTVQNTGEITADYKISLLDLALADENLRMPQETMKYQLVSSDIGLSEMDILPTTNNGITTLYKGTIEPKKEISFTLRVWISDEATIAVTGKTFYAKLQVDGNITMPATLGETLNSNRVGFSRCRLNTVGDYSYVKGQCPDTYVWYSGKLWKAYARNNKTGAYRLIADETVTSLAYNLQEKENQYGFRYSDSYAREWLNQEFLPTLVDYDQLLNPFAKWNYTESSNTQLPCYYCNTDYVGLISYSEILNGIPINLFTSDQLQATYILNNGGTQNTFGNILSSGTKILDTFTCDTKTMFCNTVEGKKYVRSFAGVRPVIEMYPSARIAGGDGLKKSPFQIENNQNDQVNGTLLNTRQSGEYIRFMDRTFRIVGIEQNLTKIIDLTSPIQTEFDSNSTCFYNSSSSQSTSGCHQKFTEATIGSKLEAYYQSIPSPYKEMIQPNTTWYVGKITGKNNDYQELHYLNSRCQNWKKGQTFSNCETPLVGVTSNLGLPYYGEMFSNSLKGMWFATSMQPYPDSYDAFHNYALKEKEGLLQSVSSDQLTKSAATGFMTYLKSTVQISNTNTGDGTYEHPYEIEGGI